MAVRRSETYLCFYSDKVNSPPLIILSVRNSDQKSECQMHDAPRPPFIRQVCNC